MNTTTLSAEEAREALRLVVVAYRDLGWPARHASDAERNDWLDRHGRLRAYFEGVAGLDSGLDPREALERLRKEAAAMGDNRYYVN